MKENKEFLSMQVAIQILKEVAKKFRSLKEDATIALLDPENLGGYKEKLVERANLLVDLPNNLAGVLEEVDPEVRRRVLSYVEAFAAAAQERLGVGGEIGLATLLVEKGSKKSDRNDIEKLIASLESD